MSWLSKNVLDPIAKDIAGFFTSSDPNAVAARGAVVAAGTQALNAVNPVFDAAESGIENVIDTALNSLGPIGQVAEATVVNPTYQLLAAALKAKIDAKLGLAAS